MLRAVNATLLLVLLSVPWTAGADASAELRVTLDGFAIDVTEVTIGRFRLFAQAQTKATHAEISGGGYEYAGGWQQRSGWTWSAPYGNAGDDDEPAVHLNWHEARAFCVSVGGRLPSFNEWRRAAYDEMRTAPADGFQNGRTYTYPVGDDPQGMNTSGADPWPRHAPIGETRRGVNGLYDMGANVWEWLADRNQDGGGDEALTAGGSWWYAAHKTQRDGAQFKPADFAAVYIGFRCAYDL